MEVAAVSNGPVDSRVKQPVFVESGRRGARKRWNGQRIARLDELDPAVRDAVITLIEAAKTRRVDRPSSPTPEAA